MVIIFTAILCCLLQSNGQKVSSIYSHGRSSSSLTHSRYTNSLSSSSDLFRHTKTEDAFTAMDTSATLTVPKILENYRRNEFDGSQHGGQPSRPSSRPSMPPAAFWRYAAEKQASRASSESLQSWQLDSERRKREPSICRYPIIPTRPETAATCNKRVHHSNHRASRRRSYESIRKGIGIPDVDVYSDNMLCTDLGEVRGWEDRRAAMEVQHRAVNWRSQSKRLVKKRQPWDAEPRRKSRTKSESLPNEARTRPVHPLPTPKRGQNLIIGLALG